MVVTEIRSYISDIDLVNVISDYNIIPQVISNLIKSTKELNLSGEHIVTLTQFINYFTSLKQLNVSNCNMLTNNAII